MLAEGRHAQRGEGVDEAGGQTAEAAVAEARLVFGVDDVLDLEAEVLVSEFLMRSHIILNERMSDQKTSYKADPMDCKSHHCFIASDGPFWSSNG